MQIVSCKECEHVIEYTECEGSELAYYATQSSEHCPICQEK